MQSNKIGMVQFDITTRCNFNCNHCYASELGDRREELSFEDIAIIIDNLCIPGVASIAFYGGEPLIRNDIEDIIRYCTDKEIDTYVVTNGYYINSKIESLAKNGLKGIAVSIDGITEDTYKKIRGNNYFNIIKNNFSLLRNIGIEYRVINFVLMKENMEEAKNVIDFALEVGATRINYEIMAMEGNAIKNKVCSQVEPKDLIKIIEDIAISISRRKLNEEFVNIDIAPPKLIEYINKKHGLNFVINERGKHILLNMLYIDYNGLAFPCKGVYPNFNYKSSNMKLEGVNLLKNKAIDAIKTEQFVDYFLNTGPDKLKDKLDYCSKCKFFIRNCYPCPLALISSDYAAAQNCTGYPISKVCEIVDSFVYKE